MQDSQHIGSENGQPLIEQTEGEVLRKGEDSAKTGLAVVSVSERPSLSTGCLAGVEPRAPSLFQASSFTLLPFLTASLLSCSRAEAYFSTSQPSL